MKTNQSIPMLLMGMALCSGVQAQSLDATDLSRNNEEGVVKVNPRERAYRENQILVKFREGSPVQMKKAGKRMAATISAVDALFAELGVESAERLMPQTGSVMRSPSRRMKAYNGTEMTEPDMSTLYKLDISASAISVEEACEKFAALADEVEFAEPNYLVYALSDGTEGVTYDDPLYSQQWGIPAINLDKLWAQPKINTKRPVIAILDTGVDITHPDLAANIWTNQAEADGEEKMDDDANGFKDDIHGWDFVNQTGNMRDNNGHGTHCAGIAAAVGGNGIGIVGANPDAFIMPVTVLQSDGTGDIATIIKGLDYASANGADVISMSLGSYATSTAFEQALGKAYATSVLVAAAGNDGHTIEYSTHCAACISGGCPLFPAAYSFVFGVEASQDELGSLSVFSNYDNTDHVYSGYGADKLYNYELRASGSNILSTYLNGRYKSLNGTSMACPLAAGAISRLLQTKEFDSKEILFGDLIHASGNGNLDIYSAYQITDSDRKPSLELVAYTVDDSKSINPNNDEDGRIDAGETIDIYLVLRNTWGQANDITCSIALAENEDPTIVSILNNNVSFVNQLSGYATATSINPLRIHINEDCSDGRRIRLVIGATCPQTNNEVAQNMTLSVENCVELGGMVTEDLILSPNTHYIVTSNLAIPSGVTLSIQPGTTIKFRANTGITCSGSLLAEGTPGNFIVFTMADHETGYAGDVKFSGTVKYAKFVDFRHKGRYALISNSFENSIFQRVQDDNSSGTNPSKNYFTKKCNIVEGNYYWDVFGPTYASCCNITNNNVGYSYRTPYHASVGLDYEKIASSNNIMSNWYNKTPFAVYSESSTPEIIKLAPNYWGSADEDIIRLGVYDIKKSNGFGLFDFTNRLTEPSSEAHGMVWKVLVNGVDPQDEAEDMLPLGVGRHRFDVYFNRPMDTSVAPSISMGVRSPYTQVAINEDGAWSEDGKIYTAYLTITGKTKTDGENTIYVYGAQDDEYFEIPEEKYRFRVNVQAAGSMSTGLMATEGLGKVTLNWETSETNFDDLLGFNVYRGTSADACNTMVNTELIEPGVVTDGKMEQSFVDYDVTPGTTYYYIVKEMGTDLTQNEVSNPVAATPLTAQKGDANGTMTVDVADVVTEIAYLTNQNPQPFIFEAADVNEDQSVDILDVVGTLNIIITPSDAAIAGINEEPAVYSIEDGILYVETPVTLGGVQAIINADRNGAEITTLDDLKGFEQTSAWLSDSKYIFLAYSMSGKTLTPGKHALLRVSIATDVDLVLSDATGKNVEAVNNNSTRLTGVSRDAQEGSKVIVTDLTGRVVSAKNLSKGFYLFSTYNAEGKLIQTEKVVLE